MIFPSPAARRLALCSSSSFRVVFSRNTFSFSSSSSSSISSFINDAIKKADITVFSKSYCSYSRAALDLLGRLKPATIHTIELDHIENGMEIQQMLLQMTGQRTVPNIFVGGVHLGGYDDTVAALRNGKIHEMLNTK